MSNGSRWDGRDPRLRLLRTAAGLTILALIAYVVIDPSRSDLPTVGTLLGALLVILGYEASGIWKGKE